MQDRIRRKEKNISINLLVRETKGLMLLEELNVNDINEKVLVQDKEIKDR